MALYLGPKKESFCFELNPQSCKYVFVFCWFFSVKNSSRNKKSLSFLLSNWNGIEMKY